MASVRHPNLAMIFGVDTWHGAPMLLVEYLEAGTLAGLNVVSTIPEPIAAALHYGCAPGDSVETLLVFDLFLPPGKHVPSRHTHPIQEERFTILAGTMGFRLGWHRILATPSDTIVVPPGVAHWFGNAGAEVVHARVEVRPALRTEALFATVAAIEAGEHPANHHWVRQLPAFARLLIEFQHEVAVPDLAAWLVRPLLAVIARLGQRSAHVDSTESHHDRS